MDGIEFSLDSPGDPTTTTGSDEVSVEHEAPVARRDHLREKMESGKYLKWLKVIGKCIKNMFEKSGRVYYILISEKKVLPSAVLLVGMMYTAIAIIFYFE